MTSTTRRGVAAIATAALATAGLPLLFAPSAQAADIAKDFAYGCDTNAGIALGVQDVGVRPEFTIPDKLFAGQTVKATPVKITLTLPETLRKATKDLLKGTDVSGQSDDAALTVVNNDSDKSYLIANLKAAKQPVPDASPWKIAVNGKSPDITLDANASGNVQLRMPQRFNVKATIYRSNGETIPVTMDCKPASGTDTLLVSSPLSAKLTPTVKYTVSPKTITTTSTDNQISVRYTSDQRPTGSANVYDGKTKIGSVYLKAGAGVIKLPQFTSKGTKTLRLKYNGDFANEITNTEFTITVK